MSLYYEKTKRANIYQNDATQPDKSIQQICEYLQGGYDIMKGLQRLIWIFVAFIWACNGNNNTFDPNELERSGKADEVDDLETGLDQLSYTIEQVTIECQPPADEWSGWTTNKAQIFENLKEKYGDNIAILPTSKMYEYRWSYACGQPDYYNSVEIAIIQLPFNPYAINWDDCDNPAKEVITKAFHSDMEQIGTMLWPQLKAGSSLESISRIAADNHRAKYVGVVVDSEGNPYFEYQYDFDLGCGVGNFGGEFI